MPRVLLSMLLVTCAATLHAATEYASAGEEWWSYVRILADDNMEGRNTGSKGYERAASFVADEFAKSGLRPVGTKGFFQPMKFDVREIIEDRSLLELVRDGQVERLSLSEDANLGLPEDMAEKLEAEAVFVGYGLVIPELGIDDLAGLQLKGKIAVFLAGGPKSVPAPLKAHYSAAKQRWAAFRKAGVVGEASILNPKSSDIPWSRASLARLQPKMHLAYANLNDVPGLRLSLRLNPANADKFLAGTGHTMAEVLALAADDKPLPRFGLAVKVRAKVAAKKSSVTSMNVAAVLPGSDPNLKREYVVLSAHLDHLGIQQPINGDALYNGAMDNASGVACLLNNARSLAASSEHPKRSVLFLAVTGEEKGLQGSRYFASYPTVPKSAIVADINVDMFLPLFPLKCVRVWGLDESTLGEQIRSVGAAMGLQVQRDPQPDRLIFIRSDQYNFIRQGIPALMFAFGYEPDSPEDAMVKQWLKTRYHAPSDDLDQPVDKAAAGQFTELVLKLAERVANDAQRPSWKPESFFRRFAPSSGRSLE